MHPQIIDALVELYLATGKEYVSNIYPRSFPDGLDIEVFDANRLLQMNEIEERLDYREHVTKGFREDSSIPRFGLVSSLNLENIRLTVDYPEDLDFLRRLISAHPLLLNSSISELLQIIKLYNEKAFED